MFSTCIACCSDVIITLSVCEGDQAWGSPPPKPMMYSSTALAPPCFSTSSPNTTPHHFLHFLFFFFVSRSRELFFSFGQILQRICYLSCRIIATPTPTASCSLNEPQPRNLDRQLRHSLPKSLTTMSFSQRSINVTLLASLLAAF